MHKEIPDKNWLIPKEESVLSTLFDPEFFHQFDHHNQGNFLNWLDTNNSNVITYIKPCQYHPNLNGHKRIAEFIADQIMKI